MNLDINRGFHTDGTFAISGSINLSRARAWARHVLSQPNPKPAQRKSYKNFPQGTLMRFSATRMAKATKTAAVGALQDECKLKDRSQPCPATMPRCNNRTSIFLESPPKNSTGSKPYTHTSTLKFASLDTVQQKKHCFIKTHTTVNKPRTTLQSNICTIAINL